MGGEERGSRDPGGQSGPWLGLTTYGNYKVETQQNAAQSCDLLGDLGPVLHCGIQR